MARRVKITMTTAADGSGTAYSEAVHGHVVGIVYVKTDFDNGSTMTFTTETLAIPIWAQTGVNASAVVYPRAQVHSAAGAGLTYDGTRTVCEPVLVCDERIKVVVASGGDTKNATWYVLLD